MGMNYYVVSKKDNKMARELFSTYKNLYNTDELNETVRKVIMQKFKPTLDYLNATEEYDYKVEEFEEELEETIRHFVSDIKYGVCDIFDLEENRSIHIGKSSAGWLFCFQEQNTYIDDVPVEWHNYKQVKDWLNKYVTKKKMFVIKDEEDRELSVKELFDLIDTKQKEERNLNNSDNFKYCNNVDGYRFSNGDFS